MTQHLIGKDILLMRKRYDEALEQQGQPCTYQFPNMVKPNEQAEAEVDSYSEPMDTHVFLDGNPKVKTYKRYGFVADNDADLVPLLHCSWNLPNVQKDSIFTYAGLYSGLEPRIYRVIDITYDAMCADHLICRVVLVANGQSIVGRTKKEIEQTFSTSNHFFKQNTDYRGNYYRADHEGDK